MANEVLEIQSTTNILPVSKQAVEELKQQRELLADFVRSQLKEADFSDSRSQNYGEGDYGIIPGTKKKCLLKSGAEKLLRLFGLGVRFVQIDKEIDRAANFALYTYRAEIYIIKTGLTIASCEATANSQEVKYKERTEWKTNAKGVRESTKVETPIFDVLNTLQKMAQKRAFIGATLLATGASEYFTQDMLEPEDLQPQSEIKDLNEDPRQEEKAPEQPFDAPVCCGKKMLVSKYVDPNFGHAPYYCMTCKKKMPREAV